MFSGEQRISLQPNACIWQVHQHHKRSNWIQLSLHSRTVQVHLSAPLCSLLWSPPSLKVLLSPRYPSVTPQRHFRARSPGSRCTCWAAWTPRCALLCSISHLATWAHHLRSLLLISEEDFANVFPLSHSSMSLLINELIFTSLEKVWAHLLHIDKAVQCLPVL